MRSSCLFLFMLFIFSCTKDQGTNHLSKPAECDSVAFNFTNDILPILNSNCNFSLCHGKAGEASYDFTMYSVFANRVRAGTVDYRLDLPFDDPQHMPEKMHLSKCDYYIIKTWIKQGYPEN